MLSAFLIQTEGIAFAESYVSWLSVFCLFVHFNATLCEPFVLGYHLLRRP